MLAACECSTLHGFSCQYCDVMMGVFIVCLQMDVDRETDADPTLSHSNVTSCEKDLYVCVGVGGAALADVCTRRCRAVESPEGVWGHATQCLTPA